MEVNVLRLFVFNLFNLIHQRLTTLGVCLEFASLCLISSWHWTGVPFRSIACFSLYSFVLLVPFLRRCSLCCPDHMYCSRLPHSAPTSHALHRISPTLVPFLWASAVYKGVSLNLPIAHIHIPQYSFWDLFQKTLNCLQVPW